MNDSSRRIRATATLASLALAVGLTACAEPASPEPASAEPASPERASPEPASPVVSVLPGQMSGEYAWNGRSFVQNSLWTHDGMQYAVWIAAGRRPTVGRRHLPDGQWSTFDLSEVAGNPLAAPIEPDNHNVLAVAVDAAGYVHVAGNMHADPLRYLTSTRPGDITSWQTTTMLGVDEQRVTYPRFVSVADELLFFYREGGSGDGRTLVNAYDAQDRQWSRRADLFDGAASDESPYLNRVAVDDAGAIHAMVVWRGTTSADTNRDVSYARSRDGGVSWEDSAGQPYTLPIAHDTIEVIWPTAPTGSGLLNQSGLAVDAGGNPYGAFLAYDASGVTQVFLVRHDGSAWDVAPVTSLTRRLDLAANPLDMVVSRPSVFFDGDRVWVLYTSRHDHPGQLRAVDVTGGSEVTVATFDSASNDWELSYDNEATDGILHMLWGPANRAGDGPRRAGGLVVSVRIGEEPVDLGSDPREPDHGQN